jgi:O-antigen ligase
MVQSKKNIPNNLFSIACIYYIADMLLPVMQFLSNVYIDIFMVMVIIFSIFSKNLNKTIKFSSPFLFVILFYIVGGLQKADSFRVMILSFYNALYFVLPILLSYYLLSNNYRKTIRILLIESIFCIVITAITSIFGLMEDPFAARELATGMAGDPRLMVYYAKNIAGFSFTYMIPIIIPTLFSIYKEKKIKLFTLISIIAVFIYFVQLTQYTIALISVFIAISSLFFARNYSPKKIIIIGLIIILVFIFLKPLISNLFFYIAANNSSMDISIRFTALAEKLIGGESNSEAYLLREAAYNTSLNSFISSPIFGSMLSSSYKIGGHSFILDMIASFGLIGIAALFLMYRQINRFLYKPFKSNRYYGFMMWSLLLSIFLSILNTSANIFAIGMFVSMSAYYLQNKVYLAKSKEGELI